jgi:hypothetical protein
LNYQSKTKQQKRLAILISFERIGNLKTNWDYLINEFTSQLDFIYLINIQNLTFYKKKNYNLNKIKKNFSEKVIIFSPKNIQEFKNFLKNKNLVFINNLENNLTDIKILFLIRNYNQVVIQNIGHVQLSQITDIYQYPIKTLVYYLKKKWPRLIIKLLSAIGLLPKIDVRFTSNSVNINKILKNPIKKFLYTNKFLYTKKIHLVNSRAYDIYLQNKFKKNEKYIVHLDASLNYYHETDLVGHRNSEILNNHYFYLKKFLLKLSAVYNKKVIVCIHPSYNLEEHQKFFKDFKVLKFVTREYIYKAFIVTVFDSSSIIDAVVLNKRIIGINSKFMSENEKIHSSQFSKLIGYKYMSTQDAFDKTILMTELNNKISKYKKYIAQHIVHKPKVLGSDMIIKYLKREYNIF